jgi:hypothetical protein
MMSLIWRTLLAAIIVGGPVIWFSASVTDAVAQFDRAVTDVRGPMADNINNDDPDEVCKSSNPRKRKKCHYNGWDLNTNGNDNGNAIVLASDISAPGDSVTVDGLTVELSRTAEPPVINAPLVVSVKGNGAAIERVWWWAEGPVHVGPFVDDLAFVGTMSYDCAGSQPCAWSWPVVARYLGPYTLHARIRDTAGREVQTDWKFDTVEAPRP